MRAWDGRVWDGGVWDGRVCDGRVWGDRVWDGRGWVRSCGAGLAAALVAAGAVDRIAWFLAPMLIGGAGAPSALGGEGAATLALAPRLRDLTAERVGEDVLVSGRLRPLPGTV